MADADTDKLMSRAGADITAMWLSAQGHDPANWLSQHGWAVSASTAIEMAGIYGRSLEDVPTEMKALSVFITASLSLQDRFSRRRPYRQARHLVCEGGAEAGAGGL